MSEVIHAYANSELKQVTFLTTRTSTGSKVDVFHHPRPQAQARAALTVALGPT